MEIILELMVGMFFCESDDIVMDKSFKALSFIARNEGFYDLFEEAVLWIDPQLQIIKL